MHTLTNNQSKIKEIGRGKEEFRGDERLVKPTCKTRESIHLREFIRPVGQIAPKYRTIPSRQGATQEDNSKKKSQIDEKIK